MTLTGHLFCHYTPQDSYIIKYDRTFTFYRTADIYLSAEISAVPYTYLNSIVCKACKYDLEKYDEKRTVLIKRVVEVEKLTCLHIEPGEVIILIFRTTFFLSLNDGIRLHSQADDTD